ncbi:MAG TPA: hypothetical protein VNA32_04360, partial [Actinomycetota bacterium]|nr:hypothetical protein [Actinomycetota bacterium]
ELLSHGPVHQPVPLPGPQVAHEVSYGTVDHPVREPVRGPVRGPLSKPVRGTPRPASRGTANGTPRGPARGTPAGSVRGTPDAVGQIASHLAAVRSAGDDPATVSVRSIADATGVPRTTVSRNLAEALDVLARPRVVAAEVPPPATAEVVASPESLRS